jgi:hypothetical protein
MGCKIGVDVGERKCLLPWEYPFWQYFTVSGLLVGRSGLHCHFWTGKRWVYDPDLLQEVQSHGHSITDHEAEEIMKQGFPPNYPHEETIGEINRNAL